MGRIGFMAVAALGLVSAGCAGSNRFEGGFPSFSTPTASRPAYSPPPGPPPAGQDVPRGQGTALPPPVYPGSGPAGAPGEAPPSGGSIDVADLPPPTATPNTRPPAERVTEPRPQATRSGSTALVGTWTARDGTGSTCRMTLSSTPSLDLNRASASGCANKDLARVNAWKQDGSEVYLYAAGTVVARMPASSMSGVITRSGAPVNLSR